MGIPLEEYAEAPLGIVTIHALQIITVAARTMRRRDMTSIPPRLGPPPEFRSCKNFPMPLLVPLAPGSAATGGEAVWPASGGCLWKERLDTPEPRTCSRSLPSQPPTTAGPRDARVSNIWSPAGRSRARIDPPHPWGWRICRGNLRLDPRIARLSLLPPVS